jgi:glycolate oxidase
VTSVETSLTTALVDAVGRAQVMTDPDVLEAFRRDRAALSEAGRAAALVRARSVDHVVATLRLASAHGVPVVPRGAGTGLAGGANAVDGAIVLSLEAMDQILDLDVERRTATAQCGVLTGTLAAAAAEHGLWYPPDPASRDISTIGGNVATNAGGGCCLKYGVTGDHVAALTAVLADGTVLRTGTAVRKNVAGLDLTRLIVGSEGTLAVVVDVTVRLRPAPRPAATVVASFADLEAAGAAIVALEAVAEPSLLELMDRTTINAVEDLTRMGLDRDAGALLLVQCDGPADSGDAERCAAACEQSGATWVGATRDPAEGEQLMQARRSAYPALERKGATLLDDVAVAKPDIPAMVRAIEVVAARHGLVIGTFGHAGDGNLHPTIAFEPGDPASVDAARAAFDDIVRAALDLGGTISGEHGIGTLKRPYLEAMVGAEERALMGRIKHAFDPAGILNPGKAI